MNNKRKVDVRGHKRELPSGKETWVKSHKREIDKPKLSENKKQEIKEEKAKNLLEEKPKPDPRITKADKKLVYSNSWNSYVMYHTTDKKEDLINYIKKNKEVPIPFYMFSDDEDLHYGSEELIIKFDEDLWNYLTLDFKVSEEIPSSDHFSLMLDNGKLGYDTRGKIIAEIDDDALTDVIIIKPKKEEKDE
jgi:hypothetical protein